MNVSLKILSWQQDQTTTNPFYLRTAQRCLDVNNHFTAELLRFWLSCDHPLQSTQCLTITARSKSTFAPLLSVYICTTIILPDAHASTALASSHWMVRQAAAVGKCSWVDGWHLLPSLLRGVCRTGWPTSIQAHPLAIWGQATIQSQWPRTHFCTGFPLSLPEVLVAEPHKTKSREAFLLLYDILGHSAYNSLYFPSHGWSPFYRTKLHCGPSVYPKIASGKRATLALPQVCPVL